jgi:hypothetical protein
MRICPQCKKEHDDTCKVCLKCGVQLSEIGTLAISGDQFLKFSKGVDMEFQKINARLNAIEKSIYIETSTSGKAKIIEAPKVAKVAEAPIPQAKKSEDKDIESTIGLVWLNRIGLLALFLGRK